MEVKAGKPGTLKSLHLFMGLKWKKIAVRVNVNLPVQEKIDVTNSLGERVQYQLLSFPMCLLGQFERLVKLQIDS